MCFHNSLSTDAQSIEKRYNTKSGFQFSQLPIYHAQGFDNVLWPIVTSNAISLSNWGLIPSWFSVDNDSEKFRIQTLNARCESLLEKASFKHTFLSQRCIIPSTGFFEWQHTNNNKIPWFIKHSTTEIFSMAGIYDTWRNKEDVLLHSFSIITTSANTIMENIHNTKKRMPLILNPADESDWLNDKDIAKQLLDYKIPSEQLIAYTINNKWFKKGVDANNNKVSLPLKNIQNRLFD